MALGDINSTERGTGARYNDGKPDVSLIPLAIIARAYIHDPLNVTDEAELAHSLEQLGLYQVSGDVAHLDNAISLLSFAFRDCADVLAYGAKKYAAWNWAKGMSWSSVLACAGRHALNVLEDEQKLDAESGLKHVGHYLCNLVFLRTFVDSYPEGNDLPPPEYFEHRTRGVVRLGVDPPTNAPVDDRLL